MSTVFNGLLGKACRIYGDELFDMRCTVLEVDDDWIKLENTDKRGKKSQIVYRIDNITKVVVDD